ncbi:alpha/beta fold hydrolase [Actinoplanes sp. NPDC049596]|uniref:alpha/beta fold hydrolase n=1 Tax=unclassified Actinoplanes TaxID=2626549 RepID=UPI0034318D8B
MVCPSSPGYGFSDRPAEAGWGVERVAGAWATLMGDLGYERFIAQGHDWGTSISTALGLRHPSRVIGLHLMPPLVAPLPPVDARERAAVEAT